MAVAAQSDPAASPARKTPEDLRAVRPVAPVANVAVANVGQVGVFKSRSPGVPATSWLVWFGTFFIFHILGMSSSQVTHIFQRGRYTTKQLDYFIIVHFFFAFFRHFPPKFLGPITGVQELV